MWSYSILPTRSRGTIHYMMYNLFFFDFKFIIFFISVIINEFMRKQENQFFEEMKLDIEAENKINGMTNNDLKSELMRESVVNIKTVDSAHTRPLFWKKAVQKTLKENEVFLT